MKPVIYEKDLSVRQTEPWCERRERERAGEAREQSVCESFKSDNVKPWRAKPRTVRAAAFRAALGNEEAPLPAELTARIIIPTFPTESCRRIILHGVRAPRSASPASVCVSLFFNTVLARQVEWLNNVHWVGCDVSERITQLEQKRVTSVWVRSQLLSNHRDVHVNTHGLDWQKKEMMTSATFVEFVRRLE